MWWPSVWHIPLETGFYKARGERSIVPVQDQVDRGKGTKGLALVIQDIRWDYPDPKRIEGGRRIKVVPGIGSQVIVIEGEFCGIPEEVEDAGTEVRSGVPVACGLSSGTSLVEVVGKDLVRLIWKAFCGLATCSQSIKGTYTRASSGLPEWYS